MIYKAKNMVEQGLLMNKELRDNDIKLMIYVWKHQAEQYGVMYLEKNSVEVLFGLLLDGKISQPSTIVRIRRKLQQECVELRGYRYNKRIKNQTNVINAMEHISAENAHPSYK